ncbi:hypothetical protein ACQPYH_39775 [Kribbella sp. CA-245084]|uniref:hypothetical protein n=1 Tax=Kribbella sp. CA-245084 TaxID=3239940 RepID=UPI003D92545B
MEIWAILVTGAVGLLAGQIGAWLQGRRDAAADRSRQGAEIERLNLQLADARESQARERLQRDTMEWRERRLDAYRTASSAYQVVLRNSAELTRLDDRLEIATAITRIRDAAKVLEAKLEECSIISTHGPREAAWKLVAKLEDVLHEIARYERLALKWAVEPIKGGLMLEAIMLDRRGRWSASNESVPSRADCDRVDKLIEEVRQAEQVFFEAGESWRAAVRSELGVPN